MRNVMLITMLLLVGCGPTAQKLTRINIGMSKNDVIQKMGQPASVSAQEGVELLNYRLTEEADGLYGATAYPYFVKLKNGIVESFGRLGTDINMAVNK